ncbi:MAG: hypothetical protein QXR97_06975 [Thermoproteota archaeon]
MPHKHGVGEEYTHTLYWQPVLFSKYSLTFSSRLIKSLGFRVISLFKVGELIDTEPISTSDPYYDVYYKPNGYEEIKFSLTAEVEIQAMSWTSSYVSLMSPESLIG